MLKQISYILLAFAVGILASYCVLGAISDEQGTRLERAKVGQHIVVNGNGFLKTHGRR